ncbi:MAG TPA: immunity 49 family protein, partial [Streptomyces sp.]
INLFYLLARKDMDNFGPALADALKLHRAYWTMVDDRREDINSTFALAPLAIACLAFDAGIPLDVESDYLPEFLLQPELPVSPTG